MSKHIKNLKQIASSAALGSILAFGLGACDGSANNAQENIQKQGATVFIQKQENGSYKIVDEFPSNETRVFLREIDENGKTKERLLSQEEIDKLVKEENAKIQSGNSGLTNPSLSSGGMGLGEAILASAAGAIIGSWIGSKLFNSPNYQNMRQNAYKNPSAYNKSVNSFKSNAAKTKSSSSKSGFFGSKSSKSPSKSGGFFGG